MWTSILGIVSGLISGVGKLLGLIKTNQDQRAGIAMQTSADDQAALKAETSIAQAEAQAPKTDSGIDERLKDGTF